MHTLSSLKQTLATQPRVEAEVHGQADQVVPKETRDGKPFYEVTIKDAESRLTLRAWSDSPAFAFCEQLNPGAFLGITGEFVMSQNFGLDARRWQARLLAEEERDALLAGPADLRARQAHDRETVRNSIDIVADPRLRSLAQRFLSDFGDRFHRAAAARGNHHARRGGLVEHVAQMMRSAHAICNAYPGLNRDLMTVGVLFHDCGKLWENQMPADGFTMPFDERGELLGHITIGIEVVNSLWRKVTQGEEAATWKELVPESEDVRLHLLHLIAAHHGELQFGSPVPPKTPEAIALHYIDNLDAKMEMFANAYAGSRHLAPRIQERVWPLPGNLVTPLPSFLSPEPAAETDTETKPKA